MDRHDIIAFRCEGEKTLGVVIDHCTSPLDDFYVIYADYSLHKTHNPEEDAELLMPNVIIPSCEEAIADFRMKRQHLRDIGSREKDIRALIDALIDRMDAGGIFGEGIS